MKIFFYYNDEKMTTQYGYYKKPNNKKEWKPGVLLSYVTSKVTQCFI